MMRNVLAFDNRIVPNINSFQVDASMASFHRSNEAFLRQLQLLCKEHAAWLRFPEAVITASSSDRCQIHRINNTISIDWDELLCCKYHASMENPYHTWTTFLVDLVKKYAVLHESSGQLSNPARIIVFVPSILLGAEKTGVIESVKAFGSSCRGLKFKLEVTILSIAISETSSGTHDRHISFALSAFETPSLSLQFRSLINSPLYYENELRQFIVQNRPIQPSSISFSNIEGSLSCQLELILIPCTLLSADALHEGLSSPEVFCTIKRSGIAPNCLAGRSLVVKAQIFPSPIFADYDSFQSNAFIFSRMCYLLAKTDLCIIFKVQNVSQAGQHSEYWVLVPPFPEMDCPKEKDYMELFKLIDKEDFIGFVVNHGVNQNPAAGFNLVAEEDKASMEADCDQFLNELVVVGQGSITELSPLACPSGRFARRSQIQAASSTAHPTGCQIHTFPSAKTAEGSKQQGPSSPTILPKPYKHPSQILVYPPKKPLQVIQVQNAANPNASIDRPRSPKSTVVRQNKLLLQKQSPVSSARPTKSPVLDQQTQFNKLPEVSPHNQPFNEFLLLPGQTHCIDSNDEEYSNLCDTSRGRKNKKGLSGGKSTNKFETGSIQLSKEKRPSKPSKRFSIDSDDDDYCL